MNSTQKKQLTLSYTIFLINGMIGLCTGSLLPYIREARGFDYAFGGQLMKKYIYAWSFILTTASLGSIIMPSVIGAIAENSGIVFGMSTVIIVAAIDMIFIFLLTGYRKRQMLI